MPRLLPLSFMTADCGARLPLSTMMCFPAAESGALSGITTVWPTGSGGSASSFRFCAHVLPVTVRASPWTSPASSRIWKTRGTPPMACRSTM